VAEVDDPPMVTGLDDILFAKDVMANVPLLINKEPFVQVDELLPLSISVPAPTLVRSLPEVEFVMVPLSVTSPLPPMLEEEPRETFPDQVDPVPELLMSAPPLEIPVPLIDNCSVAELVNEKPFMSSTPPEVMEVPLTVVPTGPEDDEVEEKPNFNVALALTVVESVKVFALDKTNDVPLEPPTSIRLAKVVVVELVL